MWLCMTSVTPSRPSSSGAGLPLVATAAAVMGTSAAERRRSKDQWYEPCGLDGGGNGVGSFTVPLYIARTLCQRAQCCGGRGGLTTAGDVCEFGVGACWGGGR
jgi:hypothetical protein